MLFKSILIVLSVAVLILVVALIGGGIIGAMRDRQADREEKASGEYGASETWNVRAISNDGPDTISVDMADLRTRLDLEDIEIDLSRNAKKVIDSAVDTLLDDAKWEQYLKDHVTQEIKRV